MKIPRFIAYSLCTLPWIAAVCVVGWLAVLRFPPSGIFIVSSQLERNNPFIHSFLPAERVLPPGVQSDGWTGQRITDDPTYFTTTVPGPYQSVDVELEFRTLQQPLLEFGLVRDAAGKELDLQPMYASQLQSEQWQSVDGGYTRQGASPSSAQSDQVHGIAVWDATTSMPLLQDPSHPLEQTSFSLRGTHDFYVVPAGRALDVTFGIQAANRTQGKGLISIRVFRGDEEIRRDAFDSNGRLDTRMGMVFEHHVALSDVSAGVYRIAFQADDDVFLRYLRTTSQHWVVGPRLSFGDVVGYATTTVPGHAWTNSRHIVAETLHREGLQEVRLGDVHTKITHTHQGYRLDRHDEQSAPVELRAPKGDVRIIGDAWFAFRPDAFFEPKPVRLTDATELDREHLYRVVTSYQRPIPLGDGWLRATYHFSIDPHINTLRFVLSAPGLFSRLGAVDIRRITLRYQRPAVSLHDWLGIIRQELANAWHRL